MRPFADFGFWGCLKVRLLATPGRSVFGPRSEPDPFAGTLSRDLSQGEVQISWQAQRRQHFPKVSSSAQISWQVQMLSQLQHFHTIMRAQVSLHAAHVCTFRRGFRGRCSAFARSRADFVTGAANSVAGASLSQGQTLISWQHKMNIDQ